ncbi:MAG TPA: hypothetical protein ENH82_04595 [bacterium]|nr:hypothetical protein [bacterium]
MKAVDKLLFGTAGTPNSTKPRDSITALKRLKELGLDSMELEYVRGTFPGEQKACEIASAAKENNIRLTVHGPYYINLNSQEHEKVEASRARIIKTAKFGSLSGAESITFHPGFFHGQDTGEVYRRIHKEIEDIVKKVRQMNIDVDIRPELTGSPAQLGSLEEIISLSEEIDGVYPCIDWSHLHARTGANNTAKEFQSVLDFMKSKLGEQSLKSIHMHISGIEYGSKGEKKHLNLDESDFNYKDLMHVLKDNGVFGFVVCESPSLEDDALILKEYYEKI